MDMPYTPVEFLLLNNWQRDFPLVPEPFAAIGAKLSADEAAVLSALKRLSGKGAISRVGAVLAPRSVGASTLAAMAVPRERLEEVAALVSGRPEVNHNYEREHHYNLWFVATAADEARLALVLDCIAADAGCPVLPLPLLEEFHIDLGFDLAGGCKTQVRQGKGTRRELGDGEKCLMAALQPGLELVPRPFALLAGQAGMEEDEAIAHIARWQDEGIVKRFGVVVRHHELGFRANAMAVFDVPDDEVSAVGARLAGEPGVTLCYRRRRHLPEWPFNLFCMVHGRSREEVLPVIERLCGTAGYRCEALFSTRRFKQCGARYLAAGHG